METTGIRVATPDGHASELAFTPAADARTGLLFVPAMGVPARKYRPFADALAARGIATAVHEWRGGGSSTWRASRAVDWGYATLLDDLAASREALAREVPALRWRIGGHSLGAQLALLAHARAPGEYDGLAIAGAGMPWWRSFPHVQPVFLLGVFAFFRSVCALVGHYPGRTLGFADREARGVIRDWSASGLSGRYDVPDANVGESALAALATPVLAVRFARDWLVPARSLEVLLEKLPLAQVERVLLDASDFASRPADHFGWMREPDAVADAVARWTARGDRPVPAVSNGAVAC